MGTIDILSNLCNYFYMAFGSIVSAEETVIEYMTKNSGDFFDPLHQFTDTDIYAFLELTKWSTLIGIVAAVLIVPLGYWVANRLYRVRNLKWWFLAVWLYGFVVYDIGMCTGQMISLLTNAPMAVLYAFKIFLFDSDVSEIHEPFHESWFYSLNFALVHLLAAFISTLVLIRLFGFNIWAGVRMWRAAGWFGRKVKDTYVFFGYNEQSVHLIESIQQHYEELKSNDFRIIVVRSESEDKEEEREYTVFTRFFDFLSMPRSEMAKLQTLNCFTCSSYANLVNINPENGNTDIIGNRLRLKSLKKLLGEKTLDRIHLLFLSDDDNSNIHDVLVMQHDSTLNDFINEDATHKRQLRFYCHARYNSVHRVIEDQDPSDQIIVKVVDSSHINVELLKCEEDSALLPVNFVEIEKDATVSSEFNALVVGFSEVGQDSVRFLYEFGAFVKSGGSKDVAVRSTFHLDVVDKNMETLAGSFIANAPAIEPSMPFLEDGEKPGALITLHEMDCRSVQFYQKLTDEWIQKLNYVVVATDNDELNISLGVRIFKAATRYRKDLKKFCILVRAHNDDDGHIRGIANLYNRLWRAYESAPVDSKGRRIHQRVIKKEEVVDNPIIHIFGLDKKTFTYKNIIADDLEQKARDYYEKYNKTVNPDEKVKKTAWDDRYDNVMQLDEEWIDYAPTYFGIQYLRRSESQDMANSQHEKTKRILADSALGLCHLKDSIFSQLTRERGSTEYIWPRGMEEIKEITRIATVLAQTEHLRWNASHEILGYVPSEEKDEVRLKHDCLKDWGDLAKNVLLKEGLSKEELEEEYNKKRDEIRSYDFNVSDFIWKIDFMHD